MSLLSEVLPTTVFETTSPLSGRIKVVEHSGELKLVVGGLVQSVSKNSRHLEKKYWGRLADLCHLKKKNAAVLILGLGGGTVAHLLSKKLNPKKIICVEVEPVIVEVAKRFFDLNKIRNLEVFVEDAGAFVKRSTDKFDYILVDAYVGDTLPKSLESLEFLKNLKKLLSEEGLLVFNRIFRSSRPRERLRFRQRVESVFGAVAEEVVEGPSDYKNYIYRVFGF